MISYTRGIYLQKEGEIKMHVVLGAGNLGCNLVDQLMHKNIPVKLFSITVNDWKYPQSLEPILSLNPKHIWVCLGSTSTNLVQTWDVNVRLALELLQKSHPKTTLHFFSTTMHIDTKLFHVKRHLEEIVFETGRPNTNIYRVSHIYGNYKPQKSLPYLIHKNKITSRKRLICPTPADWLAETLLGSFNDFSVVKEKPIAQYLVTPRLSVQFDDFVRLVNDDTAEIEMKESATGKTEYKLSCNNKSWLALWQEQKHLWGKFKNVENKPK